MKETYHKGFRKDKKLTKQQHHKNDHLLSWIAKRSILVLLLFLFHGQVFSQTSCDSTVPSFVADLSSQVDTTWISPDTTREGLCCSASSPDRCIEFELTLHPDATGIIFNIYSGAEPPGALFYQVACSSPTPVGEPLCLSGPGPHLITFCKPGSNNNEYSIEAIPPAEAGPDLAVNDGCSDTLRSFGFTDSTIQWTSVSPGAIGDWNSYLSCDSACDSTIVTPQPGFPSAVQYEVCGQPIGGCDVSPICDTVTVNYNPTLGVNILPADPVVCVDDTTTTIIANGSGGTSPYTFNWSNGQTGDSIDVPIGTYWVEISDTSDCPPSYDTADVTELTTYISVDAGPDQTLCAQDTPVSLSGSVSVAQGGTWFGGNGTFSPSPDSLTTTYNPTDQETNNGSLNLYLQSTGNFQCPGDTDTVALNFIQTPIPTITTTGVSCFGNTDGTAEISLPGGASSFSFSWDSSGFQADSTITGLSPGSHSVTVQDTNGCDTTVIFAINEPAPLDVFLNDSAMVSCDGGSDGWLVAQATGGTPPYSYEWNTSPIQSTDSATGLQAGNYIVDVVDSNGCTTSDTFQVTEPPPLTVGIANQQSVSCTNDSDGYAIANASGGVGGYSYTWNTNPVQTGDSAGGLQAGNYIVQVMDTNGCTANDTVQITEPPPVTANITDKMDVSCANDSNGYAVVSAAGGVGGYTYSWNTSPTQTGDTAISLQAGTYIASVTDANGCPAADTVQITEPPPLVASIVNQMDAACDGLSNGYAVASVTGGTPGYSYTWNTNPIQTGDSASGLDSNSYSVIVEDTMGCTDTTSVIISDPDPLDITAQPFPVSCNGGSDGSATATATGGTAPYSYSWNTTPTQDTNTATNLSAGSYIITVTDDQGCFLSDTVQVSEPLDLNVATSSTDITCNGLDDGTSTVFPSGGTPPYSYSWNTQPPATDSVVDSLTPGNHTVVVTDSNNCTDSATIFIDEPAPLTSSHQADHADCNGDTNGSLQVLSNGGNPPYSYNWDNPIQNQTSPTVTGLGAGSYTVFVSDSLGCNDTLNMTIQEPQPITLTTGPDDTICHQEIANLSASATGGNGDFTYLWQPDSLVGDQQSVSPQNSTIYSVTVADSLGCTAPGDSIFIFVTNLNNDTLLAMADTDVCLGEDVTLSGQYAGEGDLMGVEFLWSPTGNTSLSPHTATPDTTTNYVLQAMNYCMDTISDTVQVEVYPLPEMNPTLSNRSGCPPLKVTFENDTGSNDYIYEWNFGDGAYSFDSVPTHTYAKGGIYQVSMKAKSNEGCVDSTGVFAEVFVYFSPIAAFEPNPERTDMLDPEINFIDQSIGSVAWRWDFGDGTTDSAIASPTHTYQDTGIYMVTQTVWSDKGCKDIVEKQMVVNPSVTIYVPNSFTPEEKDGVNDEFFPKMTGILPHTFEMLIFNRWGEVIFESHHPDDHWKGDAKGDGVTVKNDVYVYMITVTDVLGEEHEIVGHVTLVR